MIEYSQTQLHTKMQNAKNSLLNAERVFKVKIEYVEV
jgi:hypothetical protein